MRPRGTLQPAEIDIGLLDERGAGQMCAPGAPVFKLSGGVVRRNELPRTWPCQQARIAKRQRPQQQRIDHGEDARVCADAERESRNREMP